MLHRINGGFCEQFEFLNLPKISDIPREEREIIRDCRCSNEDIRHLNTRMPSGYERGEPGGSAINPEHVQRCGEEENLIFLPSVDTRKPKQFVFGDDRHGDLVRSVLHRIEEWGDSRRPVEVLDEDIRVEEHAHTLPTFFLPETLLLAPTPSITLRTNLSQPMEIILKGPLPFE